MKKMAETDYRKILQHLSQRIGLDRLFDWWLGELSAMASSVLSGASRAAMERRVLVEISGPQVSFSRVVAGKVVKAGQLDMTSLDVAGQKLAFQSALNKIVRQKAEITLCLEPGQALRKELSLPLAAEENLRQVVAFEMDRHTPFKADQVYFDCRHERGDKQIEVSLVVAPRVPVDERLSQLTSWGAQVTAVRVADDETDVPWNILPTERRQKDRVTWLSRRNIALASGAVVLFCVVLALPIWKKREIVLALHLPLDKARKQAVVAEGLRDQLEAQLAEYNYLLNKKRESPPVVAVLEDVTRVLPDDTWVQQFDLKGKEMMIQGETASSSKLAGLFEQAKTLHNANFRAPLTKGQGANSERFQLAAETRPLPYNETVPQAPTLSAQTVVAQPAPGQGAATAATAEKVVSPAAIVAPATQEKDTALKPSTNAPGATSAHDKPAVTKPEIKLNTAPAASSGNKP